MIARLLETLEENPASVFRKKDLISESKEQFEQLKTQGFLTYSQPDQYHETYPCPHSCGNACPMDVVDMDGDLFAICLEDTEVDPIPLTKDDIAKYHLCLKRTIKAIREANKIAGDTYELNPKLHFMGERMIGGINTAFILALFANEQAAVADLLSIPSRIPPNYERIIVITPSLSLKQEPIYAQLRNASMIPITLSPSFDQKDFKIIALDEIITILLSDIEAGSLQKTGIKGKAREPKDMVERLWTLNNDIKELFEKLEKKYENWCGDSSDNHIARMFEEFTKILKEAQEIRNDTAFTNDSMVKESGFYEVFDGTVKALKRAKQDIAEAEEKIESMNEKEREEKCYQDPFEALREGFYRVYEDFNFSLELMCLENNVLKKKKANEPEQPKYLFKRSGDMWEVAYKGKTKSIKHQKGMLYIEHLLRNPKKEFKPLELKHIIDPPERAMTIDDEYPDSEDDIAKKQWGMSPVEAKAIADKPALRQYYDRLTEIDAELEDAIRNKDQAKEDDLLREKDAILQQVRGSTTIQGQLRQFTNNENRVKDTVSKAIARAIDSIKKHHTELSKHLAKNIRRGNIFSYSSEPKIDWHFE